MALLLAAGGRAILFGVVTALSFVAVGGASARAADLVVKEIAPPRFDWTGLYAGIDAGVLAGTITGPAVAGFNFESTLWGVGVSAGYRYQLPDNLVLGLDISAPIWSSQTTFTAPVGTLSFHPLFAVTPEAQIGYAIGRFLPFAGFGVGLTDTRVGATPTGGATAWASGLSTLWLATFGIDYAVTNPCHCRVALRPH